MNLRHKSINLKNQKANLFGETGIGINRNFDLEVIHSNHGTSAEEEENDIYYYHTDHLGSSSWITYTDGSVTQHIQNLPFGEPFIDQRATSYDIRYKFTGKEMDSETGYQFPIAIGIGARYYDSDISVWLSVDPLASFYSNVSSYMYVLGNPIRNTDPNGMWVKGAGFFSNIFKSDARINAENKVEELKSEGIEASMRRNIKAGGWDVGYTKNDGDYKDIYPEGGMTLPRVHIDNFHNKNSKKGSKNVSDFLKALSFAWDTRLIGKEIPDVITLSLDLNSTFVRGGQMSYSVNFMTRGDKGIYLTRTEMETKGFGPDWGLNIGGLWYEHIPINLNKENLAGPVESASGGFVYGGSIIWALDPRNRAVAFRGFSTGVGLTVGGNYAKGKTYLGWK